MHDDKSTGRGEPEGQHPKTSKTGDTRDRLGQKNIFPGASNSKILIAFESVSTPWRKEPASVGPVAVVGDSGEKKKKSRRGGWWRPKRQRHVRYPDGRWDPTEHGASCQLDLSG